MTSYQQEIGYLRRQFEEALRNIAPRLFGWTRVAKGSAMGDTDQVETADGLDNSVGDGKQRPVRRLETWGFRGFPVAGVRSFWIRLGSSNVLHIAIAPSKGYGPTDLKEGETAVYSEKIAKALWANADGNTLLASADGGTVQLNGDTYHAPQWDPFIAAMSTLANTIVALPAPTTLPTAISAIAGIVGAFSDFKVAMAAASQWKSQKVTNG